LTVARPPPLYRSVCLRRPETFVEWKTPDEQCAGFFFPLFYSGREQDFTQFRYVRRLSYWMRTIPCVNMLRTPSHREDVLPPVTGNFSGTHVLPNVIEPLDGRSISEFSRKGGSQNFPPFFFFFLIPFSACRCGRPLAGARTRPPQLSDAFFC